jgi:hypothetical protein
MNRQSADKNLAKSWDELARAGSKEKEVEDAKYWSDATEHHLERMRNGYSEGTKLYYDSFKTRATLTTGSIVVIVALAGGVLPTEEAYAPILWLCCALLLFSMVASLRTMEGIITNVFTVLTNEVPPLKIRDGVEVEEPEDWKQLREREEKRLARRSRIASGSFLLGLGAFVVYVALPPLIGLLGVAWALAGTILLGVGVGFLYRYL